MHAALNRKPGSSVAESQALLLRAALQEGIPSRQAWLDWRSLHSLEALEGSSFELLPYIYANLRNVGFSGPDMLRLSGVQRWIWTRNQVVMRATMNALRQLAGDGILAAALSGVPNYPQELECRLCQGEIWIEGCNPRDIAASLGRSGWRMDRPIPAPTITAFVRGLAARHPDFPGLLLRITFHPFGIGASHSAVHEVWKRVREVQHDGATVRLLAPSDHLLYLLQNRLDHNSVQHPSAIPDLLAFLRQFRAELHWGDLAGRVQQLGLALQTGEILASIPVEAAVQQSVQPIAALSQLSSKVAERGRSLRPARTLGQKRHLALRIADRWRDYCEGSRAAGRPRTVSDLLLYVRFCFGRALIARLGGPPGRRESSCSNIHLGRSN
jgi:hypothetical protein